ncbi:WecB/TagA/CpsF family glycosyltransferase [Arthrobacter sp. BHU FT2]|jgi:N-acetylglucosaminyldiphosphoundecaprenol N-acetyl-beta-D-mannosaminyltransferase|uniref:Glycosyl transferase n=1 Tax=Pseudarthrobacter enclensis TaxID=993070 RepID=A0A0V8IWM3_9MICC|nr:WecB/TagA/CpsF family glycosyltransferase [Pseudarthrobacter enclensis]KSU79183.1 glycosyl transferase [Pseudarthrobacter enclensis]MBT2250015.1 WecB/TagA/CpsF family glycosyltransferase [Arthrobacter sp. BHU FT2]SCB84034.1 N-acetylglucosaminyldiphosphoundecaprenol N-acetyl-beta-D-mannosaminyltransferase [Pseudarthrobacter enclensis]
MALDRQQIPVLDVHATPLRVPELVEELGRFIEEGSTRTVLGHNLHSVTLALSDDGFRRLYEDSDVVLLDGAPVLWLWGRTGNASGSVMDYRLGSTDWLPALGQVRGLERIAVVGAGAEANAGAVSRLQAIVPGARVAGFPGEGWNPGLEDAAVAWLHREQPQLVLIGLGMPLQEDVLQRRLAELPSAVYCAVGGAIEQLAGIQKLAPRWLGRMGLEWAWRLLLHPRRVAYRVFGEPWVLLWLLAARRFSRRGR